MYFPQFSLESLDCNFARSVLFLENVNAILSEQKNCRELFLWLVEAKLDTVWLQTVVVLELFSQQL